MDHAFINRINKIRRAVSESLRSKVRVEDITPPVPSKRSLKIPKEENPQVWLQSKLRPPTPGNRSGEIQNEEEPQGWSLSKINPAAALKHLPNLHLKKGWRLVGYQFMSGHNGNGVVHAVPESSTFDLSSCLPQNKEVVSGVVLATPRPEGCADSFMDAIESDGSDEAYAEASLLYRELESFGARWHGVSWGAHTILMTDPWSQKLETGFEKPSAQPNWKFHKPKPESWEPSVKRDGEAVTVSFFTFSALGQEAIYLHRDIYQGASMTPEVSQDGIASGRLGYVH